MKSYLLFDTHYLCHRAYHTTGGGSNREGLTHLGVSTGTTFGVLRDIDSMVELFQPDICVFAFDSGGPGLRKEIYAEYKSSRQKERTEAEMESLRIFNEEIKNLATKILPNLGFRNIFRSKGYEGDDIIAKVVQDLPNNSQSAIITGDQDLFQLLSSSPSVVWRHPGGKLVTFESFKKEYGIDPVDWVQVKAIAGCSSDDVPGVPGVGEKTAIKYILRTLPRESKKFQSIEESLGICARNMKLVRIPLPGLPEFILRQDEVSQEKREKVYSELGIASRRPQRKGLF